MTDEIDFKPRLRSEFGMGQFDFIRYARLLDKADVLMEEVLNYNLKAIMPFFVILRVIYANFRPIVFETKRTEFQKKFNEIKKLIEDWQKKSEEEGKTQIPITLIDKLETFYQDLLELKQIINLGIRTEREESPLTKLKRAAGLIE